MLSFFTGHSHGTAPARSEALRQAEANLAVALIRHHEAAESAQERLARGVLARVGGRSKQE